MSARGTFMGVMPWPSSALQWLVQQRVLHPATLRAFYSQPVLTLPAASFSAGLLLMSLILMRRRLLLWLW